MLIVSWNINSIRARRDLLLDLLCKKSPDILLLQETKVEDDKFPSDIFSENGYNVVMRGQKMYNGVAIASKHKITDVAHWKGEARYIEAVINGLLVASVYVPNGREIGSEHFVYKKKFISEFCDRAVARNPEVFIAGGDFNITKDDACIAFPEKWEGKLLCSDEERGWFSEILDSGLNDSMDGSCAMTWWDYRRNAFVRGDGLRIDYFLASASAKVASCGVFIEYREAEKASDHAPIWIKLQLAL